MNWRVIPEASLIEPFVTRRIAGELSDEASLDRLRTAIDALVHSVMSEVAR